MNGKRKIKLLYHDLWDPFCLLKMMMLNYSSKTRITELWLISVSYKKLNSKSKKLIIMNYQHKMSLMLIVFYKIMRNFGYTRRNVTTSKAFRLGALLNDPQHDHVTS